MSRSSLTHYPQGKRPGTLLFGRSDDVILGNRAIAQIGYTRCCNPPPFTWVKTADQTLKRLAS
jgi:hypothetical protein